MNAVVDPDTGEIVTPAEHPDPACSICHGTGVDDAFWTTCARCVKRSAVAALNTATPPTADEQADADDYTPPDPGQLVAWLREQCSWSFVARKLCAVIDSKGGRVTPSIADQAETLRLKCEAKRPGSGRLDLAGAPITEPAPRPPARPRQTITEGLWRVNEEAYRVARSQSSGRLYACRLDHHTGTWSFAPGAMTAVEAHGVPMTLAEAKAYGRRTGRCCVCGRKLTDDSDGGSVARGIGPVCARRWA